MRNRVALPVLLGALVAAITVALVSVALAVPQPTGPYGVGRLRETWVDSSRPEAHSEAAADRRAVPLTVWYPAASGTGRAAAYIPDLAAIGDALVAGGELARWQVWGLSFVRDSARDAARIAPDQPAYPVVMLSPGNATNVAFYSALAEDLASHGYVVVGVDHPYQVAAVALPDGTVARYDPRADAAPPGERQAAVARRIDDRVADMAFVLDRLRAARGMLEGRLDMDAVAVMGHSNGGLAAVELCRRGARLRACVNLDGQQEGGPFSVAAGGRAPEQPFLFLTKEAWLHPEIGAHFEEAGTGAYRVVIPEATHQQFTDGPLFEAAPLPFGRPALRVMETVRELTRAFLDRHLAGKAGVGFGGAAARSDVYVNVYPLGDKPPIPAGVSHAPRR